MPLKTKAYSILIGFLFYHIPVFCQNQKVADSLAQIYKKNILKDTLKLELLRNLAFNEVADLNLSLKYAEELIALSNELGNNLYLHRGYLLKGNNKKLLGNLDQALDYFIKSGEAAKKANYRIGEGTAYTSIAIIYSIANNHKNSILYHKKAINVLKLSDDNINYASALLNAGDEYLNHKDYKLAKSYFLESKTIFEKANHSSGIAYSIGNLGMVYANTGENDLAEKSINEAVVILEKAKDFYPICVYLISMADIYNGKGEKKVALNYAQRSLDLARQFGLKDQISDANLKLSEYYQDLGDFKKSYSYYKDHILYRDSVSNLQSVQKIADLRTDFEVSQKQVEVDLLQLQKKNQQTIALATIIASILLLIIAIVWYRRYRFIKRTDKIIKEERDKSDNLLLNILPEETALELKQFGKVQAKRFESVTVLFTDFKGFTHYAESLSPEELVETVDFYFSKFDEIMGKYDLEKIKTVGDSYMCAGGLPFPSSDHPYRIIEAAIEIAEFVQNSKQMTFDTETRFDIRIGVNTGPVVAGVVGSKKFAYDIWGDTVNIASRMESTSDAGRINISENTYELIKDKFACEYRGELEVKNRGKLKMYFVNGRK